MKRTEQARIKALLGNFKDTPDDLVFWSFRYFLGRMTIRAACFAEDLARAWPHLDDRVKSLIVRELEQEFERDDVARASGTAKSLYPLGADCYRAAWELVRRAYQIRPSESGGGN